MTPLERAEAAVSEMLLARVHLDGIEQSAYSLEAIAADVARAVLQAIREPSREMLRLDNRYPGNLSEDEERTRRAAMRADWQAMIDAALEEGANG